MTGKPGKERRFFGMGLQNISFILSNFGVLSAKLFVFIYIAGWVTNCPKPLRVFNNIAGCTFIFDARALRLNT
jgi:hypothetical protein